jgi:hypothetical protein
MSIEYRAWFNGQPAEQSMLDRIRELRIDQGIDMAAEAELELAIEADDNGAWSGVADDGLQAFERVRLEVKTFGDGDFVALIDGPIVGQRFVLAESSDQARMTLVVHDDSVLLNQDETVQLFEEMSASDIATQLFVAAGLSPEVDSLPVAAGGLERVVVQRGTPMQLLRDLARRHGVSVYVKPGAAVGTSVGVFRALDLTPTDHPVLYLMGPGRNIDRFECEFDALRPTNAAVSGINLVDKRVLDAGVQQSSQTPLGARQTHQVVQVGNTLLARTREESADLDAATQAVVDFSSWAYSAEVEVSGDSYGAVLQPYEVVTVAGPGGYLGGDYLVGRVLHTVSSSGYVQQLSLRRNARSDASGGLPGLSGGVF